MCGRSLFAHIDGGPKVDCCGRACSYSLRGVARPGLNRQTVAVESKCREKCKAGDGRNVSHPRPRKTCTDQSFSDRWSNSRKRSPHQAAPDHSDVSRVIASARKTPVRTRRSYSGRTGPRCGVWCHLIEKAAGEGSWPATAVCALRSGLSSQRQRVELVDAVSPFE